MNVKDEIFEEKIFEYDTNKFPFYDCFKEIFKIELENLHSLEEESSKEGYINEKTDLRTTFHKMLYSSNLFHDKFLQIYLNFIVENIFPLFSEYKDEEYLIFQSFPTVR